MRAVAYLSLGSNLGDRKRQLLDAVEAIAALPSTTLLDRSHLYETAPWGMIDQPDFLNLCTKIDTGLRPLALLRHLQAIEASAGRRDEVRWGPRTVDIDILTFAAETIDEPGLTIPHPRLLERVFVLRPLLEIAPDLSVGGRRLADVLGHLDERGIKRVEPA